MSFGKPSRNSWPQEDAKNRDHPIVLRYGRSFAIAASDLAARGLAVLPLGGQDGKTPLIKYWNSWKRIPGPSLADKLIEKHPDANIGIACGSSGVTVVDIDDVGLLSSMIERFGETPLRTRTPSGGIHLWYRNSGERCPTALRQEEGLAVDIKGRGGFVVVPPSVRPTGDYAGRVYEFLAGSWDDLPRLPTIRTGALNAVAGNAATPLRAVKEGHRNDVLFSSLLRHANHCDDLDALSDVAQTINADFIPPLSAEELTKTVASAWQYEIEGRNWVGKEQRVYTLKSEWEALAPQPNGGDGYLLFSMLRMAHRGRNQFAVSPKAMAKAAIIPGWGVKRYRAALDAITSAGLLKEVHHGGAQPGDPSLFFFCTDVLSKGARGEPNITRTPPPSVSEGAGAPKRAFLGQKKNSAPAIALSLAAGGRR